MAQLMVPMVSLLAIGVRVVVEGDTPHSVRTITDGPRTLGGEPIWEVNGTWVSESLLTYIAPATSIVVGCKVTIVGDDTLKVWTVEDGPATIDTSIYWKVGGNWVLEVLLVYAGQPDSQISILMNMMVTMMIVVMMMKMMMGIKI